MLNPSVPLPAPVPGWIGATPVIGVLHVPALPGAPANRLTFHQIREFVVRDAEAYASGGIDALILENFGDVPFYPDHVPPETVAFLTALACEIRARFPQPLGINVLRNDGESALAVAAASGAAFIRVNVYTGARVADQGILQSRAHDIQRLKRALASDVLVFADVAVKHSAPLGERALEDEVEDTLKRALADVVIVTGTATGKPASLDALRTARVAAQGAPVFAGSGATEDSIAGILTAADGVIVGSSLKAKGQVANPVDVERVRRFMDAVRAARESA
jgi:membrane complex biogenesis BtpA family protein